MMPDLEKAEPLYVRTRLPILFLIIMGSIGFGTAMQWAYMLHGAIPPWHRILLFFGPPLVMLMWATLWFGADAERQRRAFREEAGGKQ